MATPEEKFSAKYQEQLAYNLETVLRTVAKKEIKDLYLSTYDKLANQEESEAGSAIRGRDPLSLKNLRSIFERQIDREIAAVKVTSDGVEINLMSKDLLGYSGTTPSGPPSTVDILAYYLEGVSGEHAFVTVEQYKAGRKGSNRGNFAGRVGGGFMMTRQAYEKEGWSKITGVPFADVRHPISNQKPFNEFETLAAKIDFPKYIKLALEQTNQMFGVQ